MTCQIGYRAFGYITSEFYGACDYDDFWGGHDACASVESLM
jgi:hypothetical protein